jgi:tetratricopeptide (TPR) repeat protein
VTAAGAVALGATAYIMQRTVQAENALRDGQVKLARGEWEGAVATLQHGLSAAHDLPFQPSLANELGLHLHLAEQARAQAGRVASIRELHQLADLVRFFYGANLPPGRLRALDASCGAFWNDRTRIVARLSPDGPHALASAARQDLLDLAIFYADLRLRQASPAERDKSRQQALEVLSQAEALFGPSPVLDQERASYGDPPMAGKSTSPRTAWEHYALGRSLLRGGAAVRAAHEMEQAVLLEPQGLWPNFYHGLCAYRLGRTTDAVSAFSVCIGAAPEAASCFYNRALAFDALGRPEQALRDYDQALQLDPTLADAALNRGVLHYRARRYDAARADLRRAGELGSHPAIVSFDLLLVNLALGCHH